MYNLKLVEVSPYVLRVDGVAEFVSDTYKTVIVDGEEYHKTERKRNEVNYFEKYNNGELYQLELEGFSAIFERTVVVHYYHDWDFDKINRCCIQSFIGNAYKAVADFYNIKNSWHKANYEPITKYDIKTNSFDVCLFSAYGCDFIIYIGFQDLIKYNLLEYFYNKHKGSLAMPKRWINIFSYPNKTDEDKLQNLMRFNELLFDVCEYEEDLL